MKTVKSVADLKRLALEKGAAVSVGSAKFNSGAEKFAPAPRAKPVEASSPAPAPVHVPAPDVTVDMAPVAQALERGQQLMAQTMESITHALAGLTPGEAVQEWEFSINRNPDGTLASIRARAVR